MKAAGIFELLDLDLYTNGHPTIGQVVWHGVLDGIYAKVDYFVWFGGVCALRGGFERRRTSGGFLQISKSDRWWMEVPLPGKRPGARRMCLKITSKRVRGKNQIGGGKPAKLN